VPSDEDVTEFILSQFVTLHNDYIAGRAMIPEGNLVEVSFKALTSDTMGTVGNIYRTLNLGGEEGDEGEDGSKGLGSGAFEKTLRAYCGGREQKAYKKNAHAPLPEHLRRTVSERWSSYFQEFGYDR
jgi:hypothetical protein